VRGGAILLRKMNSRPTFAMLAPMRLLCAVAVFVVGCGSEASSNNALQAAPEPEQKAAPAAEPTKAPPGPPTKARPKKPKKPPFPDPIKGESGDDKHRDTIELE
jgi:hypothetical protein